MAEIRFSRFSGPCRGPHTTHHMAAGTGDLVARCRCLDMACTDDGRTDTPPTRPRDAEPGHSSQSSRFPDCQFRLESQTPTWAIHDHPPHATWDGLCFCLAILSICVNHRARIAHRCAAAQHMSGSSPTFHVVAISPYYYLADNGWKRRSAELSVNTA